ncbi:MAG: response regulator [bacterium]|nr:response regulator [bacterium]MBK7672001.1 response regulator [bacterium]
MNKGRILVVDDEPDIVQSLTLRLGAAGYQVMSAMDGLGATKAAIEQQPDLIILDIGMPAGNGHVVVERLRHIGATSHIPVIYLTARTGEDDYRRARDGGVAKYITKPFEAAVLLAAVEDQLERSQSAR